MKLRRFSLKTSLLCLGMCPLTALFAQTPAEEDIPIELRRIRNYTFSFGVRAAGSGGTNVKFGNLGSIPAATFDATSTTIARDYFDGYADPDALGLNRAAEIAAGTVTAGGRYTTTSTTGAGTDAVTVNNGDFLSYQAGRTRSWGIANAATQVRTLADSSQVVDMHTYSAVSNGASAEADSAGGSGLEFAVARTIGRIGKSTEWGIEANGAITDINAKYQGNILATLATLTDTYQLFGPLPAGTTSYSAPTSATTTTTTTVGTVVTTTNNTVESTVPLGDKPLGRSVVNTLNGASVDGDWQVKGATYSLRLGPTIRSYLSERWAVSGGAGVSAHYIGARYRAKETFTPVTGGSPISVEEEKTDDAVSFGFYADAKIEFWPSERTGFYAGAAFESMTKDFDMSVGSRTAVIEVGKGVAIRFGIVTRF